VIRRNIKRLDLTYKLEGVGKVASVVFKSRIINCLMDYMSTSIATIDYRNISNIVFLQYLLNSHPSAVGILSTGPANACEHQTNRLYSYLDKQ